MSELFGLAGPGGFGREVMPLVQQRLGADSELVFVDRSAESKSVNGYGLMAEDEFLTSDRTRSFNIAIGDSRLRETLAKRYIEAGCRPRTIVSSMALILDENEIGEGAVLCPYSMVTSNAKIGRFFHGNIYSYVAHDCVIGDFVTFAPGVKCNGNVIVGDHAYIGTGAVIRHGTPDAPLVIGEGALIGMGAVVTKDVAAGAVVIGNPARPR